MTRRWKAAVALLAAAATFGVLILVGRGFRRSGEAHDPENAQ